MALFERIKELRHIYLFAVVIVFFVLHQWNEFFGLIQLKDVLNVTLLLLLVSALFFGVNLLITRSELKASAYTAFSFFLFLFYSLIESISAFISKTGLAVNPKLLLALLLLLALPVVIFCSQKFAFLRRYYRVLAMVLILYELFFLCIHFFQKQEVKAPLLANTNVQRKPSVYLALFDEYAGSESLKKWYGYDNSRFLHGLDSLGFKITQHPLSNYKYTVFSISSMLNADYLQLPDKYQTYSNENYFAGLKHVYQNSVFTTFDQLGYRCVNYSPFSVHKYPSRYSNKYLPTGSWLVLYPTVFDEIIEYLPYSISRRMGNKKMFASLFERQVTLVNSLCDDVLKESKQEHEKPGFYYMHFMMPHAPFVVDSFGKTNINFLAAKPVTLQQTRDAYLQYLVYTNKVILKFITQLKVNTKGKAVILVMSDHGSRYIEDRTGLAYYNILNAVYYPGTTSVNWYNGISNVNQFRILFSNITNQQIPLLKDSLVK